MKRKLDNDDVPKEVSRGDSNVTFTDLGLDSRLLQAALKEKYAKPTLVQAKGIPLALDGKDILGTSILPQPDIRTIR